MTNNNKIMIALIMGGVIGAGAFSLIQAPVLVNGKPNDAAEQKPLYWVAPMDANYRRDQPGKSPMGMALIPVYKESTDTKGFGSGAVKIAPHVVNNLGVKTSEVVLAPLNKVISTVGYVQYDEDKLVHIHPRVEGWIEQLFVKAEGDPVEQGQPLYTLYSPELVNAQEEFLIAVKRNNTTLIKAAKQRLSALQLSFKFIQQLEKTQQVKQNITFYAPQSGVVDGLKIREGFYVKPGNTLMSIGQLEQVWVEAEVFERDTAQVKSGLPVTMTLDYLPGKSWQGKVDYVYPNLDVQNRTLRVRLKFDNQRLELKPNMFAQVAIETNTHHKSILVPKEAVIRTGKQDRVVLALGEGQFKSIEVKIGSVEQGKVEILKGLKEGELVVTSAQFLIDSESSKTSDFKRMSHVQAPSSLWMEGVINKVIPVNNMVNITHGPAEAWGWSAMTMNFNVAESVDINKLRVGQSLHFEVTKAGDGYEMTDIHIMSENTVSDTTVSSATVNGMINQINTHTRVLNISRDAIEKWDRPAAIMDFKAVEHIDLNAFGVGDNVTFTFEVHDDLVIVEMKPVTPNLNNASSIINHSNHQ